MSDEGRHAFFERLALCLDEDDETQAEDFGRFRGVCEAVPDVDHEQGTVKWATTQAVLLAVGLSASQDAGSDIAESSDIAASAALHIFQAHRLLRRIAERQQDVGAPPRDAPQDDPPPSDAPSPLTNRPRPSGV